jgi:hypothetical protein
MKIDYVTIGKITIDDTVFETGDHMQAHIGGGTNYSALAIRP